MPGIQQRQNGTSSRKVGAGAINKRWNFLKGKELQFPRAHHNIEAIYTIRSINRPLTMPEVKIYEVKEVCTKQLHSSPRQSMEGQLLLVPH
jgi:hypothetical protein